MSVAGNARFGCQSCGKSYPWKPELAGKRAKCKCGQLLHVPASPPQPDEPPEPSLDDLFELAGDPSAQAAAVLPAPPPVAPVPIPSAGKAPARGSKKIKREGIYASRRKADEAEANETVLKAQIIDLYIPSGLLIGGAIVSIWRIMASSDMSFAGALTLFAVWVTFEAVLVFAGCLVGIKWLGISLGDPMKALLKICALVVGPFGVAFAAASLTGTWIVGFFVSLILYYILLSVFFELDAGEVLLLDAVIYAMQYVGRLFLLFTILNALFGGVPPAVARVAGMGMFGGLAVDVDEKPDPTKVQSTAAADNKMTDDMIAEDRRTSEARNFFTNPENGFSAMTREQAQDLFNDLYAKGATRVLANDLSGFAGKNSAQFTAELMIIELPIGDKASRSALFQKYNQLQVPRGYKEAKDIGQKYLRLWTTSKIKTPTPAPGPSKSDSGDDDE
jgi:hypothetical protein